MGLRTLIGLPIAGAIVLAIFLFMADLIKIEEVPSEEQRPSVKISFVYEKEPLPERLDPIKPPEDLEQPDPPEQTRTTIDGPSLTADIPRDIPALDPAGGLPVLDREPTWLIQVAPSNFERCLSGEAGSEHRVRLVFDVTETGQVTNVEVVSSTDRCFERSAIRAIQQWRAQPAIVNGKPQRQIGRQSTVIFQEG